MTGLGDSRWMRAAPAAVTPATMPRVATVDERYQSYNVEMAEVVGGKFWKPYGTRSTAAPPVPAAQASQAGAVRADRPRSESLRGAPAHRSLQRPTAHARRGARTRIRARERHVGELGLLSRLGRSGAATAPKGFQSVLTRRQWAGVIEFAHAVSAGLVSSFPVSQGVRGADGGWTPDQTREPPGLHEGARRRESSRPSSSTSPRLP